MKQTCWPAGSNRASLLAAVGRMLAERPFQNQQHFSAKLRHISSEVGIRKRSLSRQSTLLKAKAPFAAQESFYIRIKGVSLFFPALSFLRSSALLQNMFCDVPFLCVTFVRKKLLTIII